MSWGLAPLQSTATTDVGQFRAMADRNCSSTPPGRVHAGLDAGSKEEGNFAEENVSSPEDRMIREEKTGDCWDIYLLCSPQLYICAASLM